MIKIKKMVLNNFFVIIILSTIAITCTSPQTAGTVDDTDTGISISGKVLTKDGHGVPLVITRLAKTGFKDTTDANGVYNISVTKAQLAQAGISLDSNKTDTMLYIRDNSIFTYQTVSKWIAILPDVYIVQRNISGKLNTALPVLKKIEAVISDNSDTLSNTVKVPLWYNTANNSYSGFAYFIASTDIKSYSLYVNIYEKDTFTLTGRSSTIEFNSIAGDIEIPPFNPHNAVPVVKACGDTVVSINDTVRLYAVSADSFGGQITRWEWSINGGTFIQTFRADTTIIAPVDSNPAYKCIVRVTDNDSQLSTDTVNIIVCADLPLVNAEKDTFYLMNTRYTLSAKAKQNFGTITKWEWNIGNTGFAQTPSGEISFSTPSKYPEHYLCIVRVTDDDGNTALDTVNLITSHWDSTGMRLRPETSNRVSWDALHFYYSVYGNPNYTYRSLEKLPEYFSKDWPWITISNDTFYAAYNDSLHQNRVKIVKYDKPISYLVSVQNTKNTRFDLTKRGVTN